MESVILVDARDVAIGVEEKLQAHLDGRLHRAFSAFVFNARGEMLLQRRARAKYHSGGLWSNTCCSHPRPGETVPAAARRRLREEMGFDCTLRPVFGFVYRAQLDHGVWEHEYDHVLIGESDVEPEPDPAEVEAWRWADADTVRAEIELEPERYTVWFRIAFDRLCRAGHARPSEGSPAPRPPRADPARHAY